jgi:hypothetical protein
MKLLTVLLAIYFMVVILCVSTNQNSYIKNNIHASGKPEGKNDDKRNIRKGEME